MKEWYLAGSEVGLSQEEKKRSWYNSRMQIKTSKHTSFCLHSRLK